MKLPIDKTLQEYDFYYDCDLIKNDKLDFRTYTCNSYLRMLIYEYCKSNGLKFKSYRTKTYQYVCTAHKCMLKMYTGEGACPYCWEDNVSCPEVDFDYDGDYICNYEMYHPKCKVITVYKNESAVKDMELCKKNIVHIYK